MLPVSSKQSTNRWQSRNGTVCFDMECNWILIKKIRTGIATCSRNWRSCAPKFPGANASTSRSDSQTDVIPLTLSRLTTCGRLPRIAYALHGTQKPFSLTDPCKPFSRSRFRQIYDEDMGE